MPMTKYEGRTFTRQTFRLEECWFVNCVLRECRLFYGGRSFLFENTSFDNCQWTFLDEALHTVQLLTSLRLIQPGQTPPPQFQATSGPAN